MSSYLDNKIDLYKILEIQRNALVTEIRKAYRRLALKYHPDKNKDDGSKEKFMQIQYAYEILSNNETKEKYDNMNKVNISFSKWIEEYLSNTEYSKIYLIIESKMSDISDISEWLDKYISNDKFYDKLSLNTLLPNKIKDITKILDIEKEIEFSLSEVYCNQEKIIDFKRITKENFIENIYPIDFKQIYEKEGEVIKINDIILTGDFVIKIKIVNNIYNGYEYHIVNNDLYVKIKKEDIIDNKIKINFLDKKIHQFDLENAKKEKIDIGNLFQIENMGLNYYNTDKEIIEAEKETICRGNLFFILLI
jgi:DnaJ-class molecular chaperone